MLTFDASDEDMSQSVDHLALVMNALIALIQVKLYAIFPCTPSLLSLNVHKIFSIIFLTYALIVLCQDHIRDTYISF